MLFLDPPWQFVRQSPLDWRVAHLISDWSNKQIEPAALSVNKSRVWRAMKKEKLQAVLTNGLWGILSLTLLAAILHNFISRAAGNNSWLWSLAILGGFLLLFGLWKIILTVYTKKARYNL